MPRARAVAHNAAMTMRWFLVAAVALAGGGVRAAAAGDFELDLYRTRFEHEVAFRAAAIQVAWAAEALCDDTTEIEPFVLWSTHALKKQLAARDLEYLRRATGMDDKWRVVWLDESAPEALKVGDVVVAVDDRPLPGGETRFEMGAIFKGGSMVTSDDQGFWDVMLKAREQAAEGTSMTLTLADGRKLKVETQTGCAGSVTASSFDADPDHFWRQGSQRVKIPANAMLEAKTPDEFRWLAAFGTYFQASEAAIGRARDTETRSNAFVVGKILTFALPGAGMLLTAVEAQAEKALAVDSIVGSADLFANEVVAALGGDPQAGLQLSERMAAQGMKVDTRPDERVQALECRRARAPAARAAGRAGGGSARPRPSACPRTSPERRRSTRADAARAPLIRGDGRGAPVVLPPAETVWSPVR